MRKRSFVRIAAALALGAGFGQAMAQDNSFKIGLILPMTGPFASTGKQLEAAARLYLAQNGDTVSGKKVVLIVKDDTGAPDVTKRIEHHRSLALYRAHQLHGAAGRDRAG